MRLPLSDAESLLSGSDTAFGTELNPIRFRDRSRTSISGQSSGWDSASPSCSSSSGSEDDVELKGKFRGVRNPPATLAANLKHQSHDE